MAPPSSAVEQWTIFVFRVVLEAGPGLEMDAIANTIGNQTSTTDGQEGPNGGTIGLVPTQNGPSAADAATLAPTATTSVCFPGRKDGHARVGRQNFQHPTSSSQSSHSSTTAEFNVFLHTIFSHHFFVFVFFLVCTVSLAKNQSNGSTATAIPVWSQVHTAAATHSGITYNRTIPEAVSLAIKVIILPFLSLNILYLVA